MCFRAGRLSARGLIPDSAEAGVDLSTASFIEFHRDGILLCKNHSFLWICLSLNPLWERESQGAELLDDADEMPYRSVVNDAYLTVSIRIIETRRIWTWHRVLLCIVHDFWASYSFTLVLFPGRCPKMRRLRATFLVLAKLRRISVVKRNHLCQKCKHSAIRNFRQACRNQYVGLNAECSTTQTHKTSKQNSEP